MIITRRAFVWGAGTCTVAAGAFGPAAWGFAEDYDDADLGVSSGDPRADGVILWTRVPRSLRADAAVRWELATSAEFGASVVQRGEAPVEAAADYCVKVAVEGLAPATTYFYRFANASGFSSAVGRTRTAPAPGSSPAAWKVAFVDCQQYSQGFYAAYGHLAGEDVDLVVHLGDHIYEGESGVVRGGDPLPGRSATTLDDYRRKWRYYLSDPQYREARRLFPFVHMWDDHEVFDNYAGSVDRAADGARFTGAYQAFCDYLPVPAQVGTDAQGLPEAKVYRKLPLGDLADLFVTDQRQYRSGKACPRDWITPGCAARLGSERTMLGAAQKAWLKEGLGASRATWKVLLSEVMFTPLRVSSHADEVFEGRETERDRAGLFLTLDTWDGFPAERAELAAFLRDERVQNVVICTGDVHAAMNARIPVDVEGNGGPGVALELVHASITSTSVQERVGVLGSAAAAMIRRANPQYAWSDLESHGYSVVTLAPERLICRHVAVVDVRSPGAAARTVREVVVPVGTVNE